MQRFSSDDRWHRRPVAADNPISNLPSGNGPPLELHSKYWAPRPPASRDAPHPHFVDCTGRAAAFVPSHDLLRLMAAIPRGACAAFTPEHLAALDAAIAQTRPKPMAHKIDFRVSVPVFTRRYYFVLLGGRERRSRARLASDGQDATWRVSLAYAILMSTIASATMVTVVIALYIVKSALGIDIFPEHSFLHGIFF